MEQPMTKENETKKETEVTLVTMEDGAKVEFKGKRNLVKSSTIDTATGQITTRINFRNGKFVELVLAQALIPNFAAHGAEQKLGDAAAGNSDPDDAYLAVKELADRLAGGDPEAWNARTGDGMSGVSVLARAVAEAKGVPLDKAIAFVKAKTAAQKAALRQSPTLKPIIDRIEMEKAKGKAEETDKMLEELDLDAGGGTGTEQPGAVGTAEALQPA
jgi:hypothetical protein